MLANGGGRMFADRNGRDVDVDVICSQIRQRQR